MSNSHNDAAQTNSVPRRMFVLPACFIGGIVLGLIIGAIFGNLAIGVMIGAGLGLGGGVAITAKMFIFGTTRTPGLRPPGH